MRAGTVFQSVKEKQKVGEATLSLGVCNAFRAIPYVIKHLFKPGTYE